MGRGRGSGGGVWGGGCAPSPEFFFDLDIKMVSFGALWILFFTVQLLVLHAKNGAFGLPRVAVACTACRERERGETF